MGIAEQFVDAVLASPLGVSWLAVLEAGPSRDGEGWAGAASTSLPSTVEAAVDRIETLSFGSVVEAAVHAGVFVAGPWIGDAPAQIAEAYRLAESRAPIAAAVAERFGDQLHAPLDRARQRWMSERWLRGPTIPRFQSFDRVYGAGEFTFGGLWTATEPAAEALLEMVAAWEYEAGPYVTWTLPVRPEARVFEIHRPTDWAHLVEAYPRVGRPHPGWELPGINQPNSHLTPLLAVAGQRAVRDLVARHLVPDWASVASDYDAVHLSWAGFVTSEGCVTDLGGGDVAMLRYWFSERTLWLADTFGSPTAALEPEIDISNRSGPRPEDVEVTAGEVARILGRSSAAD